MARKLPDIDASDYDRYQATRFSDHAERKIKTLAPPEPPLVPEITAPPGADTSVPAYQPPMPQPPSAPTGYESGAMVSATPPAFPYESQAITSAPAPTLPAPQPQPTMDDFERYTSGKIASLGGAPAASASPLGKTLPIPGQPTPGARPVPNTPTLDDFERHTSERIASLGGGDAARPGGRQQVPLPRPSFNFLGQDVTLPDWLTGGTGAAPPEGLGRRGGQFAAELPMGRSESAMASGIEEAARTGRPLDPFHEPNVAAAMGRGLTAPTQDMDSYARVLERAGADPTSAQVVGLGAGLLGGDPLNPGLDPTDIASLGKAGIGLAGLAAGGLKAVGKAAEKIGPDVAERAPIFFSQLERTLSEKMPNRASPDQIRGILRGSPVKPDELKWTGFEEWLTGKAAEGRPVTKQEALEFVRDNQVQIKEVTKGGVTKLVSQADIDAAERAGNWDQVDELTRQFEDQQLGNNANQTGNQTRYGQYTLPGGENYRELLITLPPGRGKHTVQQIDAEMDGLHTQGDIVADPQLAARFQALQEERNVAAGYTGGQTYRSSHWDEPNVLAHVRFNERVDAEGKRVLFVEEIQSDWHQAGRQKGYLGAKDEAVRAGLVGDDGLRPVYNTAGEEIGRYGAMFTDEAIREHNARMVPSAPFAKTWPELTFKRVLRWAAENDFDRVAWTTGKQQAERYNLANFVDEIRWQKSGGNIIIRPVKDGRVVQGGTKTLSADELADNIGADAARRIIGAPESAGVLAGDDLSVGNQGMQGFYDVMLPETVQKLTKKWGAKVGETQLPRGSENRRFVQQVENALTAARTDPAADRFEIAALERDLETARKHLIPHAVHSIDLTPALKADVLGKGQPLFALGGPAVGVVPQQEGESDDAYKARLVAAGLLTGAGALGMAKAVRLSAPSRNPATRTLEEMFTKEPPKGSTPLARRLQVVRQHVVAAMWDRDIRLKDYQDAAAKVVGRKLNVEELVHEHNRLVADPAAKIDIQENLQRAIEAVGEDRGKLSAYLVHQNNVEVAKALGERVEAEMLATPLKPTLAENAVKSGEARVRMLQRHRAQAQTAGDAARVAQYDADIATTQQAIARAQRRAVRQVTAADANRTLAAGIKRNQQEQLREFSGDLKIADSEQALLDLPSELGPERMGKIEQNADRLYAWVQTLRKRLLDSGVWDQETYDLLSQKYPHFVPTKVLDYMDEAVAGGLGTGKKIGLNDNMIRRYTLEGTVRDREDPLASLYRLAVETERKAMKNDTFRAFVNLRELHPELKAVIRPVEAGYKKLASEEVVIGFEKGVLQRYVMPKELAELVRVPASPTVEGLNRAMGIWQSLVTGKNIAFAVGQSIPDAMNYAIQELARASGNPLALPGIALDYLKAIPDAYAGILQGKFYGQTAGYLKGGGGFAGHVRLGPKEAKDAIRLMSERDLKDAIKGLLSLEPIAAVAERQELVPRVATYGRALRRGESALEAVIAGRDLIDFNQGGWLARALNTVIPFFRVGMTGMAIPFRTFARNPKGTVGATATLLATPVLLEQALAQSSPETARDYEDVPQYIRDRGLVFMIPGYAPVDAQGNRHPQFFEVRLASWAPVAMAFREPARAAIGKNTRSLPQFLADSLGQASPLATDDRAGIAASMAPPGFREALEIGANQDFYRGSPIATERSDEAALGSSKVVAGALQQVPSETPIIGGFSEARPSQVEHLVRGLSGGPGQMALAGEAALEGKSSERAAGPSGVPVAGELAKRLVRGDIGENLNQAREPGKLLSDDARKVLKNYGIAWQPAPVKGVVDDVRLTVEEQALYQQMVNGYAEEAVWKTVDHPIFDGLAPAEQERRLFAVLDDARQKAQADLRREIGPAEWAMRRREAMGVK